MVARIDSNKLATQQTRPESLSQKPRVKWIVSCNVPWDIIWCQIDVFASSLLAEFAVDVGEGSRITPYELEKSCLGKISSVLSGRYLWSSLTEWTFTYFLFVSGNQCLAFLWPNFVWKSVQGSSMSNYCTLCLDEGYQGLFWFYPPKCLEM